MTTIPPPKTIGEVGIILRDLQGDVSEIHRLLTDGTFVRADVYSADQRAREETAAAAGRRIDNLYAFVRALSITIAGAAVTGGVTYLLAAHP